MDDYYKRKNADQNDNPKVILKDLAPLNDPTSDKQVANTKTLNNCVWIESWAGSWKNKEPEEYKEALPIKIKPPELNEQNTGHIYLG